MSEDIGTDWNGVLDESHRALRAVVAGVPADSWLLSTPCAQWTVTQVVQHAAGDQLAYAAKITGGAGPDEDPFAPSGELSEAPLAVAERALDASAAAWATVAADAEAVPVPLPPFTVPFWLGAGACALDAAVHAWDIAVATGQPSPLNPALARSLLIAAQNIVEPVRAYGFYGPALEAAAGDDDVAVLLAYLGRRPDWHR